MATVRQQIVASITRFYPLLSGCGSLANSRLVRQLAGGQGGLSWGRLNNGSEILVSLDDFVGRAVYFVGDLDRKISRVISRLVSPGDTVLDVGANLGLVTMQLSRLVGDRGTVHSFEPNPRMVELLTRTLERNAVRNVKLRACALGSREEELELKVPVGHAGMASLVRRHQHLDEVETVRVPVHRLSAVAKEEGFGKVRLMKIDVEGFESEVFRGADEWFSSTPPDYILFESNEGHVGGEEADHASVMSFLEEKGFEIYALDKNLVVSSVSRFDPRSRKATASHDFLAAHKGVDVRSKLKVRA